MSKNNNPINFEDIKDWEDFKNQKFLDGDKGEILKTSKKKNKEKNYYDFKIDLHGFSLDEAFQKIREVIENCYKKDLSNILIITGKGLRSKVKENPYLSEDLSILRYAIPNFIKNNFSDTVSFMEEAPRELGGLGAFLLKLKKNSKKV
jgi:DNA-nicking Smr family endonuclease